jgi:hypothetical protein
MSPALSPDARTVAFVEVIDDARTRLPALDRVWLLHERTVQRKSSGTGLTWSPDGARIAMNYGATTYVFPAPPANSTVREIKGVTSVGANSGRQIDSQHVR